MGQQIEPDEVGFQREKWEFKFVDAGREFPMRELSVAEASRLRDFATGRRWHEPAHVFEALDFLKGLFVGDLPDLDPKPAEIIPWCLRALFAYWQSHMKGESRR